MGCTRLRKETGVMTVYCDYHPSAAASWDCTHCHTALCDDCVVTRKDYQFGILKTFHLCPKCNQEVDWMGIANILIPFWNRLPRFFIYPLYIKPLFLNILLCLAMFAVPGKSLVSMMIRFSLWGIWVKYSFAALQNTAKGDLNPPRISRSTISDDFQMVLKQFGIYLAAGILIGLMGGVFGTPGMVVTGVAAWVLLPAMIILFVSSGSLLQALNPVMVFGLPWRIGWGYLIMFFFLLLLGGAPTILFKFSSQFLPASVVPVVSLFFQNYYTLISYHLMGYVLLQYHEEIGYEVDYEDFIQEEKEKKKSSSPEINRIDILLKDGNYGEARYAIQTQMALNRETPDIELMDRYYQLLKLQQIKEERLNHGKDYLDELIRAGQTDTAFEIYAECRQMDPLFSPSPKEMIKLAAWLKKQNRAKEAVLAYQTFTKVYEKSELLPTVYFRAAEIFNESLDQKAKAKKLLENVIKRYPDHDLTPFIQNYLSRIRI